LTSVWSLKQSTIHRKFQRSMHVSRQGAAPEEVAIPRGGGRRAACGPMRAVVDLLRNALVDLVSTRAFHREPHTARAAQLWQGATGAGCGRERSAQAVAVTQGQRPCLHWPVPPPSHRRHALRTRTGPAEIVADRNQLTFCVVINPFPSVVVCVLRRLVGARG